MPGSHRLPYCLGNSPSCQVFPPISALEFARHLLVPPRVEAINRALGASELV
jgi:hypothetical protein